MNSAKETTFCVSGLEVHVYGLEECRSSGSSLVDVIFLLHGRGGKWQDLEPWALSILDKRLSSSLATERGLLVVAFDQRNHGHREVLPLANQGWSIADQPTSAGNPTHAQDMYSIQYGTSQDVSFLITFLPVFVFPKGEATFANVVCAGVSLGGHATYLALSNDERIKVGVVVIGCPDMAPLLTQRAGQEYKDERLPKPFLDLIAMLDPKVEVIATKDLLVLKGDDDILVPWTASEGFVSRLPQDKVKLIGYPGVGHAFPDEMLNDSAGWIVEWLSKRQNK